MIASEASLRTRRTRGDGRARGCGRLRRIFNTPFGPYVGSPGDADRRHALVAVKVTVTRSGAPAAHVRTRLSFRRTRESFVDPTRIGQRQRRRPVSIRRRSTRCRSRATARQQAKGTRLHGDGQGLAGQRRLFRHDLRRRERDRCGAFGRHGEATDRRPDGGSFPINNRLSLALDGVVASLQLSLSPERREAREADDRRRLR